MSLNKPKITTLIVDLDNTLYDWVEQWYQSFSAMLGAIQNISGIKRDILISEIKAIHEKHGTSEFAFLIEELPCLQAKHPGEELKVVYAEAIEAYRVNRKQYLQLYPGVLPTISILKSKGVRIVGYTESLAFYSSYRVRTLGLDGLIDILYSPEDHDLPDGLSREQVRSYPADKYAFKATIHRYTPIGVLKPNADVLGTILRDLSVTPDECVYIGDSLMKDIAMANELGIISAHAKYGEAHTRESYELLREVTHWSSKDVEREKTLKHSEVTPNYTLRASFAELLSLFDFGVAPNTDVNEIRQQRLAIWEKTIDVQQHFNDLSVKVRGLAITVLGALLSAVAFSLKEQVKGQADWTVVPPLVPMLLGVALISWWAFWLMDQLWYHRLLKGAVAHGLKVEKDLSSELPMIGLTTTIGAASAISFSLWNKKIELRSDRRLTWFYVLVTAILFVALVVSAIYSSRPPSTNTTSAKDQTASTPATSAVQVQCISLPALNPATNISSSTQQNISASQTTETLNITSKKPLLADTKPPSSADAK